MTTHHRPADWVSADAEVVLLLLLLLWLWLHVLHVSLLLQLTALWPSVKQLKQRECFFAKSRLS